MGSPRVAGKASKSHVDPRRFRADYDVAFDDTGAIRGYEVTLASRCGYSADVSSAINDRAMYHADNACYLPATTLFSMKETYPKAGSST